MIVSDEIQTTQTHETAHTQSPQPKVVRNSLQKRRTMVGVVVSDKMQKTIVVKVDRRVRDLFYKKYILKSKRYKAHDEVNQAKPGDRVILVESRPLSREKRWVFQSILKRAGEAAVMNISE